MPSQTRAARPHDSSAIPPPQPACRTYEYYLPASALELESTDGSAPGDAAKIAALRSALQRYVGGRPFHNYAGKRRQYVTPQGGQ